MSALPSYSQESDSRQSPGNSDEKKNPPKVRDETEYNPIRQIRATAVPGAWCPVGEPESRARDPVRPWRSGAFGFSSGWLPGWASARWCLGAIILSKFEGTKPRTARSCSPDNLFVCVLNSGRPGGGVCSGRSCGCCTEAVRGASGPSDHAPGLPYWRSRRLAARTNRCASSLAGPWGWSAHQYGVALFLLAGVVPHSTTYVVHGAVHELPIT